MTEALSSEPVQVVELMTIDQLMQIREQQETRDQVADFDLVLAAEPDLATAAGLKGEDFASATEFLQLVYADLNAHHRRVYLLTESVEESQAFYDYLEKNFSGIQIVGMAKVSAANRADDMLVNAINGGEVDCILSALSTPLQEDFIARNRNLLNIRLFLGLGKELLPERKRNPVGAHITAYLKRRMLKRELEKE